MNDNPTTYTVTLDLTARQMHDIIMGERNLKAFGLSDDSDGCAWYALAAYFIVTAANGEPDDTIASWEHDMGLAVNDSAELVELIANNWDDVPTEVRDMLATDLADFVTDHFHYLVADDTLDQFRKGYLACALWSSTMPDDAGDDYAGRPMDEFYDLDQLADDGDTDDDIKGFIAQTWPTINWWHDNGQSWEQIGHDFWLTRNGHGTGFWDRYGYNHHMGDAARKLTEACEPFGEANAMPDGPPTVDHHPTGVSYCQTCDIKLILQSDSTTEYQCTECDSVWTTFDAAARCHHGIGGVEEIEVVTTDQHGIAECPNVTWSIS